MKPTQDIIEELRDAVEQTTDQRYARLLTDAADRIEHLFASGIHTCHADCQRPLCVLRRERDKAQADLARVTAERDSQRADIERLVWNLGGCDTIASGWGKPGDYNEEMALPALDSVSRMASERDALRARVAELEKEAMILRGTVEAVTTQRQQAELRNAELEAALDDLLGCPTVTDLATCPNGDPSRIDEAPEWQAVLQISCAWTRYKKLKVLARAESAAQEASK